MDRVSKPLLGLLVGTVVFFALWIVALKPSDPLSGGASSGGVGQYNSAINAAHAAVNLAGKAGAAHGGEVPSRPTSGAVAGPTVGAPAHPSPAVRASPTRVRGAKGGAAAPGPGAAARQDEVLAALRAHRVLALLFYNPRSADDRAVRQELARVPAARGRVVKLVVPLAELSGFGAVTEQVSVSTSPTLVLIDRSGAASTITGFADGFEIAQRVRDALAAA